MSKLLEPLQIRSLHLANRLVMPPMATAKADADGKVTPAILDYYDEKSRGGHIGLIIIEHSYILPEGKTSKIMLSAAEDSCIDGLRELAAVIHRNGSRAAVQLNHAGCSTTEEVIGRIPAGPSAVAHPRTGKICRELTRAEIEGFVTAFASAAKRVKAAGFDAVEIHSAHGYLLNQFYSPLTNHRTDEYGGSLENRLRLHLRVIEAVRDVVGQDFPILLRLGAADYMPGGSTFEDGVRAATILAGHGLDVLDISGGFGGFDIAGLTGQGFFSPISEAIKQVVTIPVILTGGITEAKAAEQLLADGKADLVGVGRAIFKNSDWARSAVASLD
jgi:NADPH2 dehydrogenase